jgi:hypothetical protein
MLPCFQVPLVRGPLRLEVVPGRFMLYHCGHQPRESGHFYSQLPFIRLCHLEMVRQGTR